MLVFLGILFLVGGVLWAPGVARRIGQAEVVIAVAENERLKAQEENTKKWREELVALHAQMDKAVGSPDHFRSFASGSTLA